MFQSIVLICNIFIRVLSETTLFWSDILKTAWKHVLDQNKVFLSLFYKVLLKANVFQLIFQYVHGKILLKTKCFGRKKTARTVLDQKCFCQIFIKFYWNKCVLVNILICAWKHFTKKKVFLFKFFIKFYWKKCVSVNILICTWKISIWNKVFQSKKKGQGLCLIKSVSFTFFIKFYQNKCVSVSFSICAWINSTKTLCFGKKKTARTVLDQKCFCNIFIKFY